MVREELASCLSPEVQFEYVELHVAVLHLRRSVVLWKAQLFLMVSCVQTLCMIGTNEKVMLCSVLKV
jgi:hypothetical protein